MTLYESFPDRIVVNGTEYRLTLYFDRVLRYLDLVRDSSVSAEDAAEVGYSWLVGSPKNVPPAVKSQVIQRIFEEIVRPPKRQLRKRKKTVRAVDFTIDAAEIYASFMRDYRIDLVEEQGQMHWCRFIALFEGLSDDTPIKQIMRIRAEELPTLNKHNAAQIQRLTELKALYALPQEAQSPEEQSDAWGGLFDVLMAKAQG